jgi:hypothetical protein
MPAQSPVANTKGCDVLCSAALTAMKPRALGLFATGPKHAIASYGALAWAGNWVWQWKNRIDQAFLRKHSG